MLAFAARIQNGLIHSAVCIYAAFLLFNRIFDNFDMPYFVLDVDGFHVLNIGRFCSDLTSLIPATPAGVIELIRRSGTRVRL